ncbi:hypothetical protein J6Z39_01885 [bacterium]|nr:hypothetical protein [bacterium]
MTKKLFLTLVSVVFLVFSLTGCGDKKDDTTDTGDTAADTDNTDTGDTATTPDEDTTDTGDTATDTDEDNTDTGTVTQEGCTIKSSFGTHSAKRELSQTCIQKIAEAKSATCTWDYKNEEETSKHIEYLQKIEITFGNECKEQDKTVECPDFIPESLKFINLSGCDVYSADPDTDCEVQCADLYFQTDDDVFHTVYVGATGAEVGNEAFIRSSDVITEASFSSTLKVGSNNAVFRWYEKVEDGTEIEKTASVEMIVVDPNAVEEKPAPETDIVPDEDEEIEVIDE